MAVQCRAFQNRLLEAAIVCLVLRLSNAAPEDAFRFRSSLESDSTLKNLELQTIALNYASETGNNILQWDIGFALRKRLSGNHNFAQHLLNDLIIAKRTYREAQQQVLQRLQQLYYKIRKIASDDPLSEIGLPLIDFTYRWMVVDRVHGTKETSPQWNVYKTRLSPHEASVFTNPASKEVGYVTDISQENADFARADSQPQSLLIAKGKHFPEGFIVSRIKLSLLNSKTRFAAGFIFKFQSTDEFGYLTLSTEPSLGTSEERRIAFLTLGHMNKGIDVQFTPVQLELPSSNEWILLGFLFENKGVKIYINEALISTKDYTDVWTDDGSVGLHSSMGSVTFRGVTMGKLGTENLVPFVMKAFGNYLLQEQALLTRELTKAEYDAFISKRTQIRLNEDQTNTLQNQVSLPSPILPANGTGLLCYDYNKRIPNLDDWENASSLGWITIQDFYDQSFRITTTESVELTSSKRALILKDFGCHSSTLFTRILLGPQSQAGIIFNNKDINNRLIALIDSGFRTLELVYYCNGTPKTLSVVPQSTIKNSQLYQLEVVEDFEKQTIKVFLNKAHMMSYTYTDEIKKTVGLGYGLWIGRGHAEFVDFSVSHVNP